MILSQFQRVIGGNARPLVYDLHCIYNVIICIYVYIILVMTIGEYANRHQPSVMKVSDLGKTQVSLRLTDYGASHIISHLKPCVKT